LHGHRRPRLVGDLREDREPVRSQPAARRGLLRLQRRHAHQRDALRRAGPTLHRGRPPPILTHPGVRRRASPSLCLGSNEKGECLTMIRATTKGRAWLLGLAMMALSGIASAQTVMITGANSGIGLEFAKQYAAKGWTVIATHRRSETPETL